MATTVRPARAEFGWIYLQSLIESAERRVDDRRARKQRLRAWWAARRVEELRAYQAWRNLPAGGEMAAPPRKGARSRRVDAQTGRERVRTMDRVKKLSVAAILVASLVLASIWFVLGVACARART